MRGAWPDEQHRAASRRDGTGFDREGLGRAAVVLCGGALAFHGLRRGGALGVCLVAVGGVLAGAGMSRPLADTPAAPGPGGGR